MTAKSMVNQRACPHVGSKVARRFVLLLSIQKNIGRTALRLIQIFFKVFLVLL